MAAWMATGVLLLGDDFLELGGERASPALRLVAMHDAGKRVHRFAVDQHVELHHFGFPVVGVLVIHRSETAGDALDAVMEINEDFVQAAAGWSA